MILPFSKAVENGRIAHPAAETDEGDPYGSFLFRLPNEGNKSVVACVIASAAYPGIEPQWEHVSVHIREYSKKGGKRVERHRPPTWDEMCYVKRLFWADDEVVVQFHPAESEYVNLHQHVLHLWKLGGEATFPTPPLNLV